MGDRGNIFVADGGETFEGEPTGVYLYSHWTGSDLPEVLCRVLARGARWNDPAYLTRMIFCAMVKGREDEETGFGISSTLGDNEHPILYVDCKSQTVHMNEKTYTFQQYVDLDLDND